MAVLVGGFQKHSVHTPTHSCCAHGCCAHGTEFIHWGGAIMGTQWGHHFPMCP